MIWIHPSTYQKAIQVEVNLRYNGTWKAVVCTNERYLIMTKVWYYYKHTALTVLQFLCFPPAPEKGNTIY